MGNVADPTSKSSRFVKPLSLAHIPKPGAVTHRQRTDNTMLLNKHHTFGFKQGFFVNVEAIVSYLISWIFFFLNT